MVVQFNTYEGDDDLLRPYDPYRYSFFLLNISQLPETRWDYMLRRDDYSINLHPNPKIISKVLTINMVISKPAG